MSAWVRTACAECGTFFTVPNEEWGPGITCDRCHALRMEQAETFARVVAVREDGSYRVESDEEPPDWRER